jgi:hypothetical protein
MRLETPHADNPGQDEGKSVAVSGTSSACADCDTGSMRELETSLIGT